MLLAHVSKPKYTFFRLGLSTKATHADWLDTLVDGCSVAQKTVVLTSRKFICKEISLHCGPQPAMSGCVCHLSTLSKMSWPICAERHLIVQACSLYDIITFRIIWGSLFKTHVILTPCACVPRVRAAVDDTVWGGPSSATRWNSYEWNVVGTS